MNKRDFIKTSVAASAIVALPSIITSCTSEKKPKNIKERKKESISYFELPSLGYDYSALEPMIDARTMEIHHSKHHGAYVKKLNKALENHGYKGRPLEEIVKNVTGLSNDEFLRNNAGGHYNHSLFWEIMTPGGAKLPKGNLSEAINSSFDTFENFKSEFAKVAGSVFGSGWAWLIIDDAKKLSITTSENQDNPLMYHGLDPQTKKGTPILGIDVWEHAYYLKYQNKRAEYIQNFIKLINWDKVSGFLA